MNKIQYHKLLDKKIAEITNQGTAATLLLHSCCAPCSSYCIEYLSQYFRITVFYYNPNITFSDEYARRVEEQKRLIASMNEDGTAKYPVSIIEGNYEPERFFEVSKGLEKEPERGARCTECFSLRLSETAKVAALHHFDYYCTTLTLSRLKNSELINILGEKIGKEYGVPFLPSDFKKRNGYDRSTELSVKYGLYRQDYCGCIYSKLERESQTS